MKPERKQKHKKIWSKHPGRRKQSPQRGKHNPKFTGLLDVWKIRSSKTTNPVDAWKNETTCYVCDHALVDSNNITNTRYCFSLVSSGSQERTSVRDYSEIRLPLFNSLTQGTLIKQLCLSCYLERQHKG